MRSVQTQTHTRRSPVISFYYNHFTTVLYCVCCCYYYKFSLSIGFVVQIKIKMKNVCVWFWSCWCANIAIASASGLDWPLFVPDDFNGMKIITRKTVSAGNIWLHLTTLCLVILNGFGLRVD